MSTTCKRVALLSMLVAVCIVSRLYLQFLPNIKPVTSIIILISLYMGTSHAVKVALVSTVLSNMILGMGVWTVFQVLSWVVIAVLASGLRPLLLRSFIVQVLFAGLCGYIFGVVVSLEQLLYVPFRGYLVYYITGLPFDTLHAVGNVAFYLACSPYLSKILKKYGN